MAVGVGVAFLAGPVAVAELGGNRLRQVIGIGRLDIGPGDVGIVLVVEVFLVGVVQVEPDPRDLVDVADDADACAGDALLIAALAAGLAVEDPSDQPPAGQLVIAPQGEGRARSPARRWSSGYRPEGS